MSTRTLISFLLLSLALGTSAQAAGLEGVKASASTTFNKGLNKRFTTMAAKDILVEIEPCRIVDAKFFIALRMGQVVEMLKPCAKALGAHAGIPVSMEHEITPSGDAGFTLEVRLGAGAMTASSFTRNLRHSLKLRRNSLLGHPAKIVRGAWKPL